MSAATQADYDREANRWGELQAVYPKNLKANEVGVWWDMPASWAPGEFTNTMLPWDAVQAELVDAENDDGR